MFQITPMTDFSNKIPFHILLLSRFPLPIFTQLIPKRPEVTGTLEQEFSFIGDFTNAVVKLIQIKTIFALGTFTPGLTTLQYLANPQIHYDLMGTPITIIRKTSNKRGEFCLAKINLKSIRLFPYIAAKNDFDSLLVHGDDIPQELLLGETNDLQSFTDPLVATLVPNFVAIYYGQKFPMEISLITNNKVKANLLHLGTVCDLWGRIVEETDPSQMLRRTYWLRTKKERRK